MEATKQNNNRERYYMGVDWPDLSGYLQSKQTVSVMFSDLRGGKFDDLSLSKVEFFPTGRLRTGCRLDGTSFRGTRLHEVRFIGCFSSDTSLPTDFRGSIWQDSDAYECHLNYLSEEKIEGFCGWTAEMVEAANQTLSKRNDVRYEAATSLGRLGNAIVAPYLANLLLDKEWEVRVATLRALAQLRHQKFPYRDEMLLKWMFLRLGDEHIIVRETSQRLIQTLQPSDDILLFSLLGMRASPSDKLASLRAAHSLLKVSRGYSRLFDLETLHRLLKDDCQEVRQACLSLLAILDAPSTLPWILECLSDPVPKVRIEALHTIGWLTQPLPISHLVPLLSDSIDSVCIETLYTLSEAGKLTTTHLAQALADESPKVLRVARKLLSEPTVR